MRHTTQSYYNLLLDHSETGRFPSVKDGVGCAYLDDEGNACGIGVLIPEKKYKQAYEGLVPRRPPYSAECSPLDRLTNEFCDLVESVVPEGMSLGDLLKVQNAHDSLSHGTWCHQDFVNRLNVLPCFANVTKQEC